MENLDDFLSKGKIWFDRLVETIREYSKKLEESEKWFSTTLSSIGDAVIATDRLGNVQFMNPVAESLTGWKQEESIGKPLNDIFKIINEKTRKSVENPVSAVIREGVIVGLANHTALINKSGKEIPIADSGAPIKDDKGNIIGVVLIFRDITERKKGEQKLKESEEKHKNLALETEMILDHIPGLIFYKDAENNYIRVNKYVADAHNMTKEELTGKNSFDLYPKDVAQSYLDDDLEVIKSGKPKLNIEEPWDTTEGRRWVSTSKIPYFDAEGKITGIIGFSNDITERKKAEKEIFNLAKFPSENPNPILRVTKESILYANKAGESIFSIKEGDTLPELFQDVVSEAINLNTLKVIDIELNNRIYTLDITPIKEEGYVNLYGRDITERTRAMVALQESEEKLKNFMESATEGFIIYDSKFILLEINSSALKIIGMNREDMIGKHILEISPGLEKTGRYDAYLNVIKTGKPFYADDLTPNSKFGDIHLSLSAFKILEGLGIIFNDVTKRKLAEQKLKKSEKGYREAYNRAEFYKDLFTHDINNILQGVLSGVELSEMYMGDLEKPEKLKEVNSMIKDQVMRGARLVSNISKLSKLEEAEISFKQIEICSILEKSITYVKNSYHARNVTIQIDSISKKLYIHANELLEDVFENILVNAVKYNENPRVEIIIKVSKEQRESINYLKMEFLDNGIGIGDLRKKLIFQRGSSEETSVHGMGLGLSLVKKIIETYNGKIWVEDRVKRDHSKGSNFVLLIPEV